MTASLLPVRWPAILILCSALACMVAGAQQMTTGTLRPAVVEPLQAAQEALKKKQAPQAMRLAKEALAVPHLSSFEVATVQRVLAMAAINAKDHDQASDSLMILLVQPGLSQTDQRLFLELLTSVRQQLKDHVGVVKWTKQYLAAGGTKPEMRLALLQALFAMKSHEELVAQGQAWLHQAGTVLVESELRAMALSYRQLKDAKGYEAMLLQLLERFPSKAYWAEIIALQTQKPNANPRLELDMYRLLEETGNLEDAAEYAEMAELALRAGLPAEAQRVLETGYKKGILGQGDQAGAHLKLRQQVQSKAAEDAQLLDELERSAKDGNSWAAVGDVRLSHQKWTLAREAFAKALSAGGLRREPEVRLHQAFALFKSGEAEQCRTMLATIQDDATAMALANLWRIRSLQP